MNQYTPTLNKNSAYMAQINIRSGINKKTMKLATIIEEEPYDLSNMVIEEQAQLSQSKQVKHASASRPTEPLYIFYQTTLTAFKYLSQKESGPFSVYKQTLKSFIQDIDSFNANFYFLINELADIFNGEFDTSCCCFTFFSKSQKPVLKKTETITDQFINALISINSFTSHEEAKQYKHFVDTLTGSIIKKNNSL
ncbi:MAG: hypothetical protein PSV35_04685 [bacterium]|nr:hypothetical protein [bacterium]